MTAIAAAPEQLRLGSAVAEGFRLAARRPVAVLLLSVFLTFLPAVATIWMSQHVVGAERAARASGDRLLFWSWAGVQMAVAFAAAGVNWIYQGAVALMAARSAGLSASADLDVLGARAVWLFAVGALTNLIVSVAALALLVPALLLGLAWCISPAVAAVEAPGLKQMYRRSAELTRGHRVALFGLLIAYEALKLALEFGVRFAVGAPTPLLANAGPAWLVLGLQPALSATMSAVYAVVMGCVYLELRRLHDGGLAATFD
ncbi:MAG TPA: hypothetical protein VGF50_09935 [Caulobacteraceae bacterium]